jgi:methyl-accepting chemotaxis protein
MLGISTRIESARLGDQGLGFSTLADDVEALAGKIVQIPA